MCLMPESCFVWGIKRWDKDGIVQKRFVLVGIFFEIQTEILQLLDAKKDKNELMDAREALSDLAKLQLIDSAVAYSVLQHVLITTHG